MKDLRDIPQDSEYIKLGEEFTNSYKTAKNNEYLAKTEVEQKKHKFTSDWSSWKNHALSKLFKILQNGRCAICERKISHWDSNAKQIEHYRPKKYYWWLAYDYTNYYVACSTCNRKKWNKFPLYKMKNVNYENRHEIDNEKPLLINPLLENPYPYFKLILTNYSGSRKGKVIKLELKPTLIDDYQKQKALETINVFNLNLNKKDSSDYSGQIGDFEKFYKELIDYAKEYKEKEKALREVFLKKEDINKRKKEFKDFLDKLKNSTDDIANTGYWQMIKEGNFEII